MNLSMEALLAIYLAFGVKYTIDGFFSWKVNKWEVVLWLVIETSLLAWTGVMLWKEYLLISKG